jgi:hypothetical protein
VLGLLLKVLPWFHQVNGEIVALALPINLAVAWAAWCLAGKPAVLGGVGRRGIQEPAPAVMV